MRAQLLTAARLLVVATVVGLVYSLACVGLGRVAFPDESAGSPVVRDGQVVGSRLIGQPFVEPQYFHPRPAAYDYDGTSSGATNQGPENADLLSTVADRTDEYRVENGLAPDVPVPVDAVTTSASGLDPHISVANARLQADRVAEERNMPVSEVHAAIDRHTDHPLLGVGASGVNVLELNLDLDGARP